MKISMDKKYKTKDGRNVRILCTDMKGNNPVVGLVDDPNLCQFVYWWEEDGSAYYTDYSLIEVSPYEDFKIDDKVLVSYDGEYWKPRHFAGIDSNGRPTVFPSGTTSFTVDSEFESLETQSYNYCKKYEHSNI